MSFRGKNKNRRSDNINRLHFLMAVIFLIFGWVILRLMGLQVRDHDLYVAMASDQHNIYNELEPERGKIFIQDGQRFSSDSIYPAATNKDFALIYAKPNDVTDPQEEAEKLFDLLDRPRVEAEVDELLENDDYFKDMESEINTLDRKQKEDFKNVKRELEIKTKQENIVDNYKTKLSKKNDPYEPIAQKVDKDVLDKVMAAGLAGIDYIAEEGRYYPDNNIGAHIIGFVGFSGDDKRGQYGLEGFFDEELTGLPGSISTERSAGGEPIIINDRTYNKPKDGSDLILTINRSIQFEACSKLNEAAVKHGADGGSIIVMEPNTGAILAMCSWPDYDPNNYSKVDDINVYNNPAIFSEYEPGSIFKVITMAAGIDQGKVTPDTTYNDKGSIMVEGWPKPIKNSDFDTAGGHGIADMVEVLEKSLNTGAIFVLQKTGAKEFADYVENFGFGEKTGIEMETEGVGNISSLLRSTIRPVEAATASFGQGITVTPLQMITAYAAIANGGILMKPYLVGEIITPDGSVQVTQPREIRRVISERTSLLISGMMVKVVDGGHAIRAAVDGYYVAGKTGTAQVADKETGGYSPDITIHTFVGFAPVDDPKFVMLVKLDNPKDMAFAANSVTPIFSEVAEFILNYYQVPKER